MGEFAQKFIKEDNDYNAPGAHVDTVDYGSAGYPRPQKGPKTIEGKEYNAYLVLLSEAPPT